MPTNCSHINKNRKNSKSSDLNKKPMSMMREKDFTEQRKEKIKLWTTFYRRNIHRLVEHYFGVKLHFFQKLWLYLMDTSEIFMTIASRGISKSWMIGLYALAKGVLYPGSEIVIAAGSKKQAGLIVSKHIKGFFQEKYPNIAREIRKITANNDDWLVELHNGSTIIVVPGTELARGHRATINVYEEFRLIDKNILDTVLTPFLHSRQPPYLMMPQYEHLAEEPKELYISSCYYKAEWWYDELKTVVKMKYNGENASFLAFDYLLAIHHHLKTAKQIKKERIKLGDIAFMQEYENIPFGENADAYYKFDMFKRNRKIKKPFRKDNYDKKNNPNDLKKAKGELRFVSVDISTRKGKSNDNTIISCIRLIPTSQGYHREVVYLECHHGENTILQSLRIKQIFYDFNADYIVLDLQQAGIAVYDQLGVVTKDEERGEEFPAMTTMWHDSMDKKTFEELRDRTLALNALPVIFPISATPEINDKVAVGFRDKLQLNMISFVVDENEAEDWLLKKNKEFIETEDTWIKAWYMHPYYQMTELVNESVNLSFSMVSGRVRLQEASTARKDRFTSVAYANYVASLFDVDLLKETKGSGDYNSLLNKRNQHTQEEKCGFSRRVNPFGNRTTNPFRRR